MKEADWKTHKEFIDTVNCYECNEKYNKKYIIHHLAKRHGVSVTEQDLFLTRKKKVQKRKINKTLAYSCFLCGPEISFQSKKSLLGIVSYIVLRHNKNMFIEHEKKEHTIKQKNETSNVCKICGKHFRRPYELREHELVHNKNYKFQCRTCGCKYSYCVNTIHANLDYINCRLYRPGVVHIMWRRYSSVLG